MMSNRSDDRTNHCVPDLKANAFSILQLHITFAIILKIAIVLVAAIYQAKAVASTSSLLLVLIMKQC